MRLALSSPLVCTSVSFTPRSCHGKTAFEIEPKGIAAQELSAIWNSLKERIQEKENSRKQETMQERVNA